MSFLRALSAVLILSALASCGGGGGSPTSPESSSASFQGRWQGSWSRASCTESAAAAGACSVTPTSGSLSLVLTHSGTSVQGTVEIFPFLVPVSGSVNGTTLTLSGQVHVAEGATVRILNWNTSRGGNSMTGAFTLTIDADDPANGTQSLQIALQNVALTT